MDRAWASLALKRPTQPSSENLSLSKLRQRTSASMQRRGTFPCHFPRGVSVASAAESDIQTKTGHKGSKWKSGQVILDYPIVEAYVYGPPGWPMKKSHHLTVEFTPNRPGFLQFYFAASAKSSNQPFVNDPMPGPRSIRDQRDEPVYCGDRGEVPTVIQSRLQRLSRGCRELWHTSHSTFGRTNSKRCVVRVYCMPPMRPIRSSEFRSRRPSFRCSSST